MGLSEPAGDIICGAFILGGGEQGLALAVFHQFALQEEGGIVGGAGGLLYRMRTRMMV